MNERKSTFWLVMLIASAAVALLLLTPIVIGLLAGYLSARSGPKTVEIVRYVTTANSAAVPAARAAPAASPTLGP